MLRSRSQWQHKQYSEREEFQSKAFESLDEQFNELTDFLNELQLSRSTHINSLIQSAEAELEKTKYEAEMRRIEQEREAEKEKLALEKEHQQRRQKLAQAQAKAAEEREKSIEAAKNAAAEEEARLAKEKAAASKKEEEQRRIEKENQAKKQQAALEKAEREKAEKEKAEKERAAATAQAQNNSATNSVTAANGSAGSQGSATSQGSGRAHIEAEFLSYMDRIQWIKANVKDAMKAQPSETRKHTMEIKLQLRPKFGMLTNSKTQLMECRNAVKAILASTQSSPLVYHWALNLYAKMLIEQGESEANVKLQNALPLAMLTMLLWADFPELGDFVIPRIVKRCPQVIGYYCDISTEEGRKRMGWKFDDDTGKYETQEKYMGRLSGICAVWACMTQTKLNSKIAGGSNHPYPLSHSWAFVARQLNKPPADVGPTDFSLVAAWWDMTAMRFHEAFGRQGTKVLDLVWDTWTRGRNDPPAMRLRGLGENWKSSGKIECGWEQLKP